MICWRTCIVSLVLLSVSSTICLAQIRNTRRIVQPIDGSRLERLGGSTHPLAKPEFDQGQLDRGTVLHGVSLIFKRSSAQWEALQKLLEEQQDPRSPSYHKWLTPEEFARQFGLTSSDTAKITAWLESEGFVVDDVARSRSQVSVTGSVARIESVFGTEIHQYMINGQKHFANATDIQVPAALQDVVLAVRSLDDFHPQPRNTRLRKIPASPRFTSNLS